MASATRIGSARLGSRAQRRKRGPKASPQLPWSRERPTYRPAPRQAKAHVVGATAGVVDAIGANAARAASAPSRAHRHMPTNRYQGRRSPSRCRPLLASRCLPLPSRCLPRMNIACTSPPLNDETPPSVWRPVVPDEPVTSKAPVPASALVSAEPPSSSAQPHRHDRSDVPVSAEPAAANERCRDRAARRAGSPSRNARIAESLAGVAAGFRFGADRDCARASGHFGIERTRRAAATATRAADACANTRRAVAAGRDRSQGPDAAGGLGGPRCAAACSAVAQLAIGFAAAPKR